MQTVTQTTALKKNLNLLEVHIKNQIDPYEPQMTQNLQNVISAGGKRIRPSLAYLCARLGNIHITADEILPLETALELIHTASLIHDDIIDDSKLRRGKTTLHRLIGKPAAIRNGDYLLGKAILSLNTYNNQDLNLILARVSREMCLGEFQQMYSAFEYNKQNTHHYFSQIKRKTACLFSGCCETGAIVGNLSPEDQKALSRYGNYLGIAFQMNDDILDFNGNEKFGKPLGQDLFQGIFTLPLLYTFRHSPNKNTLIEKAEKRIKSADDIDYIIGEVKETGGLIYTRELVNTFSYKAISALKLLPDNTEKHLLTRIAIKMANRES